MATNAPDECSLCTEKYDEEERAPRCLPCIHCLCTECIDSLIRKGNNRCPFCRKRFKATEARDLGINTSLMDVLKLMKEKEQQPARLQESGSSSGSKQDLLDVLKTETNIVTQGIIDNYQNTVEKINSTIHRMKELHDNFREEVHMMQNDIMEKMKEIQTKTIQKEKYMEERIKTLEHQKRTMRKKQLHIEEAVKNSDAITSFQEAGKLLDEVKDSCPKVQENLQSFTQIISRDEEALNTLQKVARDTKEKMNIIREVLNSPVKGEEEINFLSEAQQSGTQDPVTAQNHAPSIFTELSPNPGGTHKHIYTIMQAGYGANSISQKQSSSVCKGPLPNPGSTHTHISTGNGQVVFRPSSIFPEQGSSNFTKQHPTPGRPQTLFAHLQVGYGAKSIWQ